MGFTSQQLASASMLSQVGGGITSAVGGYLQADAAKTNLKSQAFADMVNAHVAALGAKTALMQGNQQVADLTLQAGRLKASQRAAMAANGIDLGEGNAAEVQASTELMKEVDKNTLIANAVRTAWGYQMQSIDAQNQARMKKAAASGISPALSLGTSLLGSATNVASSWYKLNKTGATKGTMFEVPE